MRVRINAEGGGSVFSREIVRNHRMRGGRAACLANANADPGNEQMPKVLGEARECGHDTPDGERASNDVAAVAAVCQSGNWDAKGCVKQRKGEASEHPKGGIGQAQILLNRLE